MLRYTLSLLAAGFLALLVAGPAAARTERTLGRGSISLRDLAEYTTTASVTFINDGGYCGAYLIAQATVDGASAIVTISIDMVDPGGGAVIVQETLTATLNDVEVLVFRLGTDTAAAGIIDEIATITLPGVFTVNLTHTDADAITYSASIHFLGCVGAVP